MLHKESLGLVAQAQTNLPPCVIVENYGHDDRAMTRNRQLAVTAFRFVNNLLARPDLEQLIAEYIAGNPYTQALLGNAAADVIRENLWADAQKCSRFLAEIQRRLENYVPIVCPLCYEQAAMPLCATYRDPGHDDWSNAEHLQLAQSHLHRINALLSMESAELAPLLERHIACLGFAPASPQEAQEIILARLRHNRTLCRELQNQILDQQTRRLHPAPAGRPF